MHHNNHGKNDSLEAIERETSRIFGGHYKLHGRETSRKKKKDHSSNSGPQSHNENQIKSQQDYPAKDSDWQILALDSTHSLVSLALFGA